MSTPSIAGSMPDASAHRLRFTTIGMLLLAVAVAVTITPFRDGLAALYDIWNIQPEYSHGILIPPIAAYLIWRERAWLSTTSFVGNWMGPVLVALALLIWLVGELSTILVITQYAFLVAVYGLVLALAGWAVFRRLWMPLLVLLFMVPLPAFFSNNLSLELQLLSSKIGVMLIRAAGISVFVEGNVIDLGVYRLQVAEACDGLRYLFPLMTLAFIVAYFFKAPTWKKVLLFAASIPITILMNSLRIGVIGVTVDRWGTAMAEGLLHEFQGWMVFMISLAVLIAFAALLTRLGPSRLPWRDAFALDPPARVNTTTSAVDRTIPFSFYAALALLAIATAGSFLLPSREEIPPPRAQFVEFPTQLDGWSGRRGSMDGVYLAALKLSDYVLNDYVRPGRVPVSLYSAYYESQRKGQSAHSPRSCLPGGGWEITEFGEHELRNVGGAGKSILVNRAVIEHGADRQLMYYWFQQRGRVVTNEYAVKWYIFWDSLNRGRTDGALVRVAAPVPRGADLAAVDAELTEFVSAVVPRLSRYVPD